MIGRPVKASEEKIIMIRGDIIESESFYVSRFLWNYYYDIRQLVKEKIS